MRANTLFSLLMVMAMLMDYTVMVSGIQASSSSVTNNRPITAEKYFFQKKFLHPMIGYNIIQIMILSSHVYIQ